MVSLSTTLSAQEHGSTPGLSHNASFWKLLLVLLDEQAPQGTRSHHEQVSLAAHADSAGGGARRSGGLAEA
eukprot:764147-Hanusia_phi.AAC.6